MISAFTVNYRATGNIGCEPELTDLFVCEFYTDYTFCQKRCAVEFSSLEMTHCHLVVITGCASLCTAFNWPVNDRWTFPRRLTHLKWVQLRSMFRIPWTQH